MRPGVPARPPDSVRHHRADAASLLAEHGRVDEPMIAVSFDGTGHGGDETIWGGEILALGARDRRFVRVGRLRPVPMPGGAITVREPWRMALSQLWTADIDWTPNLAPVAAATDDELRLVRAQLETGTGCVPCSSMGRLFDAVASLLGVRHRIDYEGQAAAELEALAETAGCAPGRPRPSLPLAVRPDGVIDPVPMVQTMVAALYAGTPRAVLAAAFHFAVADAVADVVARVAGGTRLVGLTGGVFQDVLLTCACRDLLQRNGFEVLTHRTVPRNDGGPGGAMTTAAVGCAR
ncbi:hydrogenase maturation protein [Mycobacterium intracellulare]|uniref:Kae1-like domain-containing protein n=1 Tax=Mycobacterium intracellulare TaxID=1767 RepID=UPI0007E9B3BC|nr:hypothetical protein [Mycobacterium intracellulare]OBH65819.1 hydrogenase maturation protein [Mycobacterium intracellulare]